MSLRPGVAALAAPLLLLLTRPKGAPSVGVPVGPGARARPVTTVGQIPLLESIHLPHTVII